jgi:hypothetical protein
MIKSSSGGTADATDLKSVVREDVRVRVPPRVPIFRLIAQWLEQGAHNALVGGSNPSGPTIIKTTTGRYRSGQTGRTVNPLAYAFKGSNPFLPTILK